MIFLTRRPPAAHLLVAFLALASAILTGQPKEAPASQPLRLPDGRVGEPYEQSLEVPQQADIRSLKWEVVDGELPPGLTLSESGEITGTPTGAKKIFYMFRVKVVDAQYPARAGNIWCTLLVRNPPLAISLKQADRKSVV